MSLLVTTQSYRGNIPTEYGFLVEIKEDDGEIINKIRIETPTESKFGRIKPGLRGIFYYNGFYYVASWNKVFILDSNLKVLDKFISHKWMSDLHGIFVDESGIWVTSSLNDSLLLYDFNGNPKSQLWFSESKLYGNETMEVDKVKDWRLYGKEFDGFSKFHANNVFIHNGIVYVTGRSIGLVSLDKNDFLNSDNPNISVLNKSNLYGPHDGLIYRDNIYFTETANSSVSIIDLDGKLIKRRKLRQSKDSNSFFRHGLTSFFKNLLKSLFFFEDKFKYSYWTRGLCFCNNLFFVGQSALKGSNEELSFICKLDTSLKSIDRFSIKIKDYPEPRIFQIIKRVEI